MGRLGTDGGWLRDASGRIVLLRGANVSGRSKTPPFLPLDDPRWFDRLRDWGMNAVRLLVTWEGIEPERGAYDRAYLSRIAELAEAAGARGLHVIIDLHQDLFARTFGGDGAPAWAVAPARSAPATGREWFWHYASSRGVQASFGAFWRDDGGVRTAFIAAVGEVMRTLAGHEAVVGYDLFNEPMAPLAEVVRGRFERGWLTDFHRQCVGVRDRLAPGRLLLIEPTPLAAFGIPTTLGDVPGQGVVYAPHLYDATAILASRFLARASTFPRALAKVTATAQARRWPLVVGEFGVLNGIVDAETMMEDQCSQLDRVFASWMVWHFNPSAIDWNAEDASIVEPDGSERPWTAALVRPYPRALAGEPGRWESRRGRPWILEYCADSDAPTEVVIPRRWSAAPRINLFGAGGDFDGRVLTVDAKPGARVRVELQR